jgi:hypothetical protein
MSDGFSSHLTDGLIEINGGCGEHSYQRYYDAGREISKEEFDRLSAERYPPATRTAKEREEAFRRDLAELLAKHKAEMDVTDDGKPYGQHSGIAVITMMNEFDKAGNEIAEYTEFNIR